MLVNIKGVILKLCYLLFKIFPLNKNKIMFMSGTTAYSCNPKYLSVYISKNRKYDIVWVFSKTIYDKILLPPNMRKVRFLSIRYFYEISTSSVIINNHRFAYKKKKGQIYIQTWHSSLRLKKIEADAEKYMSDSYVKMAKQDSNNIDLVISGCEFSTQIFEKSFWYSGLIANTGTPRIDFLINATEETKNKVQNYFNSTNHFILYAPTFRKNNEFESYNFDANVLLNGISKKYDILQRLHPSLRDKSIFPVSNKIFDATSYEDVQELIFSSDIVITDYSSLMFDCAFAHKPCILYVPDYVNYVSNERDLYFDIEQLPFPKVYNINDLIHCINTFDFVKYDKDIDSFLSNIGSYENGCACKKIVNIIDRMLGVTYE